MPLPLVLAAGGVAPMAAQLVGAAPKAAAAVTDKLRGAAQDFEAVFLNTMFEQMFAGVDGDGPSGAGAGAGIWRSFLTEEYAKSFARAGGVGIADHVYRALIDHQAARP